MTPDTSTDKKIRRFFMTRNSLLLLIYLSFFLGAGSASGKARMIDDHHWEGVERIVAVGDLHGDYEQYIKVLQDAGLVNSRGRWSGDDAHLVQTGDIPDRGPASRAIIDHLAGLKKQAKRKGGRVHTLVGNHEAMNSWGDLRYVHEGEYEAFVGSSSKELRERLWEYNLQRIRELKPEQFLVMDLEQYRQDWEKAYPLGWLEHRRAWMPEGEYGQWVMGNQVAIKVNDTIFLHGGLSAKYCRFSLNELTAQVHTALIDVNPQALGILEDEDGPLWYRGLAMDDESELGPLVEVMLEKYSAARIVVGHTPTGGVVWPRFEGRVVVNDTGIASYYGSNEAYLELTPNGASAGYGDQKIALPAESGGRESYLRQVINLAPGNQVLQRRLARMLAPPEDEAGAIEGTEPVEVAAAPADELLPGGNAPADGVQLPWQAAAPNGDPASESRPEASSEPVVVPITADTCR
jgi:hypothetical protein